MRRERNRQRKPHDIQRQSVVVYDGLIGPDNISRRKVRQRYILELFYIRYCVIA